MAYHYTDPPGPPENVEASEIFSTSCVLTWKPPAVDGGSPVTGYWVERRLTSSNRWIRVNKEAVPELTLNVTDLDEGSEYEFRVIAENKIGPGPPSSPSQKVLAKDPWGEHLETM